jgi:hypothetical protein
MKEGSRKRTLKRLVRNRRAKRTKNLHKIRMNK